MNISEIKSSFQFLGNRIVKFNLETFNVSCNKTKLNFDVDYNLKEIKKDNDKYTSFLDLEIKIIGINKEDEKVFDINLIIEGCFISPIDSLNEDEFKTMTKKNGLITLSQIARAYLISATSSAGISPAIKLPMINIITLIEKKEV